MDADEAPAHDAACYVYVGARSPPPAVIFIVALSMSCGSAAAARRWREMVGARRVDAGHRAIRWSGGCVNVVEEMAIASGVRVPEVYVMDDERGINAFAAGWSVSDAVVAVTRGTLETPEPRRAAGRGRRTSSATS